MIRIESHIWYTRDNSIWHSLKNPRPELTRQAYPILVKEPHLILIENHICYKRDNSNWHLLENHNRYSWGKPTRYSWRNHICCTRDNSIWLSLENHSWHAWDNHTRYSWRNHIWYSVKTIYAVQETTLSDIHKKTIPDTHGATIPDTHGTTIPDTHGATIPDTHEATIPDTHVTCPSNRTMVLVDCRLVIQWWTYSKVMSYFDTRSWSIFDTILCDKIYQ